ncbi:hypothetical protein DH2020_019600 [Rehmannia glutinosa]|uniref:Uncharacterized protein n=1 Tax=Rehmannia glutinosa TaxID=99300 RepID=A0ABR0WMB6_REHGL
MPLPSSTILIPNGFIIDQYKLWIQRQRDGFTIQRSTATIGGAAIQAAGHSPQELPVDYSGFIAVIFGVFGAMFRCEIIALLSPIYYKACSWLAIIFCAQSLANMRNIENDLKQISMAMM